MLDLGLPGIDGLDVARALRQRLARADHHAHGARSTRADKLVGLELGADDYVTKPFSPQASWSRASARCSGAPTRPPDASDIVRVGDVTLDVPRMRRDARRPPIDLTPTEFQMLAALARQPGRVFTRAQLLDAVHGVAFESFERAIDAHVKNMRRKLEPDPRDRATC